MLYQRADDFLESSLKLMNQELAASNIKLEVILIGGAAMILGNIDALEIKASRMLYKYGISQYDEHYLTLLADYKERVVPITRITFSHIQLYSLGMIDLFLSKLNAGRNKDREDCRLMLQEGLLLPSEIEAYYLKWKSIHYPNSQEVDDFYQSILNVLGDT